MARPFEFDREQALEHAMLLFWDQGYFNTSAQDIVTRLQLNRSSIYNTFNDKRNLFLEALRNYIKNESSAITRLLETMPATPQTIKMLLDGIVSGNMDGTRPKGCLVVNSAIEFSNHDEEVRKIIQSNVEQVVLAFGHFIQRGQDEGYINNRIPAKSLALALFHQITALRVSGKVIAERDFFEQTITAFIQLFNK